MNNIDITILSAGIYKEILLDGVELLVFESGIIYRKMKSGKWKLITNVDNNCGGYNRIKINDKMIKRHRIIGHTFLGLDINDTKQLIDHFDRDKLNNSLTNLRVVNHQQNGFNRNSKGYSFRKALNKFKAQIVLNGKNIFLGYFTTEDEARAAYQAAKLIYHVIE